MICAVTADLKKIHQKGRFYPWVRPACCPRCQNWRVWGHGFVERYFDGFVEALPLKCYRCPGCGCVITLRPDSHFPRIRAPISLIRSHLFHRLETCRWPASSFSRSRLRHWLVHLRCRVKAFLTEAWEGGLRGGFEALLSLGQIPVACLG